MAKTNQDKIAALRDLAEADLYTFARLTNPMRLYGEIHKEVFKWLQGSATPNQLLLLPRAHMKSHCIAVWTAWWITKHPETTILYLSATSRLAELQLADIKGMLTSDNYRRYWPEMVRKEESKREKWSNTEISVDHPKRRLEGVRDFTVVTAGLTTNTTGWHADVIVNDDIVVPGNAYTPGGRDLVADVTSQMASILNPGGIQKAVGTRYHPADQYFVWKNQMKQLRKDGEVVSSIPIWDIKEHVVESDGVFLWPKAFRDDGKSFGFDEEELAIKSAMYTDRTQFWAQYYNNPNDAESARISEDKFQYYNREELQRIEGKWHYRGKRLNLIAAMDFATSIHKDADYTALVLVGEDEDGRIFVLDMNRFKTSRMEDYFKAVINMYQKWEFPRLRAEVSVAQKAIVTDLRERVVAETGGRIKIEEYRPTSKQGRKEERIAAALEPRYDNLMVYHFRGGFTPALEEEVMQARPLHDDLKDALASAVEASVKPARNTGYADQGNNVIEFNRRFGGVKF